MFFENFGLYNVNIDYIKKLHEIDSEVFYESENYENKPYAGTIITNKNYKYFIPLTSAKDKHKNWKNVTKDNYLIYETIDITRGEKLKSGIYKDIKDGNGKVKFLKHIMGVLEIKKMVPVPDHLYNKINFSSISDVNYRNLLIKEYDFLKPLRYDIAEKATKLYDEQIETGKVHKFYCSFAKLETVCKANIKNTMN